MERPFLLLAALAGFTGVALGAFGAHALKGSLTPDLLAVFETGVRYQMYHAFAIVAAAWAESRWPARAFRLAAWLFVAGILVFSGSLYALAFTGAKVFGAVTPLGGLAFLAGWSALAWGAWRATDARY